MWKIWSRYTSKVIKRQARGLPFYFCLYPLHVLLAGYLDGDFDIVGEATIIGTASKYIFSGLVKYHFRGPAVVFR